ncbi:hypothetical protein ACU4GD_37775 [Cupriavidus basilensis]
MERPARPCAARRRRRPAGTLSEHAIYLCGSPDMIRDARETFLALGASSAHIYADSFTLPTQLNPCARGGPGARHAARPCDEHVRP